jgi:5-methylcytosine-specific restriction endonuclease McrA
VQGLGYSPGAAMRRIDAARLLRELPEVAEKFQEGSLTLSQATQIEQASREFKKAKNEKLTTENKRELVLQVENATQKQTEQIIAETLDLPVVPMQKETLHRDQSVTLTITFSQEQMEVLQQAQNMISHSVTSKDWAEALTYLAKREVKRRTCVRSDKMNRLDLDANAKAEPSASATEVNAGKRPALPAAVRKTMLHGRASCGYKLANGKTCGSQRFLQIDHIHSWSRGGSHARENLQVLCGVHNRLKYVRGRN